MQSYFSEARLTVRSLRRRPAFAVTAIIILAIGVATATAMIAVIQRVLIQPLPIADPDRLFVLSTNNVGLLGASPAGMPHVDELRRNPRVFAGVAAVEYRGARPRPLVDGDRTVNLNYALVTGNFFQVLGSRPLLGRWQSPEDERARDGRAIVLSYHAWRRTFGGDPRIIGRQLLDPYTNLYSTVIGVAPSGLDYPAGVDHWVTDDPNNYGGLVYPIVRTAPGMTRRAAQDAFLAVTRTVKSFWKVTSVDATPFTEAVLGSVQSIILVLGAAVGLLLLLAAINVGNLLLLRGSVRSGEIAIRRALGAGRGDIVRLHLIEATMLWLSAGAVGVAGAFGLLALFRRFASLRLPGADSVVPSGPAIAIALAVTLVALLVFGVLPAAIAGAGSRRSLTLRIGTRTEQGTGSRLRFRRALVAAQLALALVLLAGAGLLIRTLDRLQRVPLGYTADHLSFLTVAMPTDRYGTPARLSRLAADLTPAMAGVPGVVAVTPVLTPPFPGTKTWSWDFVPDGASQAEIDAHHLIAIEVGGPAYFRTFGARVLRGRGFSERDREDAPYVAVVSEGIARRFWPGQDPIGKRIRIPTTDDKWLPGVGQWRTVVGVTEDFRYRLLRESTPTIYLPSRQMAYWDGVFAIRTRPDAPTLPLASIQRAVQGVDRQVSVWRAQGMDEFLAEPLAQPRLGTLLLSSFGLTALTLAGIGLYGVIAAAVRARRQEIAIRMALGATAGHLRRAVMAQAVVLFALGALVGSGGAWAASRALQSLLFEVSPTDPVTLVAATMLLFVVALGAAYIPANRATEVDPGESLRSD